MKALAKLRFASLLAALLAAGCGGGSGSPDDASATATAAPDTTAAELPAVPSAGTPVFEDSAAGTATATVDVDSMKTTAAVVTTQAVDAAGNAVEDFESGFSKLPSGWAINWWGTKPSYTVGPETRSGYAHSGNAALRLQVGSVAANSGVNLVYSYAFAKGGTYSVVAFMRTDAGKSAKAEVQLRRNGAPYDVVARQQVTLGDSWQKLSFQTPYPFADAGSLRVISQTAGANVYLDDVTITKAATEAKAASVQTLASQGGSSVEVTPVKTMTMDEAYTSYAPGMTYNYWGGTAKPVFTASRATDGAHVYAGAAAQFWQVSDKKGGQVHLVSNYPFVKGKTYRATLYLRADVATPVQVMMRRDEQPYDNFASKTVTVDTPWQKVEIEGTYLGSSAGSLRLNIKSTSGAIWVDQAVIAEVKRNDFAPYDSSATVPDTMFGMHVVKLGTHDIWPEMGTRIIRLWNTGTTWRDLEPSKGAWNWASGGGLRLDMYVAYVAEHDPSAKIIYTLGQTPQWASSTPDVVGKYGAGASGAPKSMDDWRSYVRTLAQRYAGKIRYWEIWNEPDYEPHYNGSISQLVEMTRIAREELLAADPANRIVSPGLTKGQGMQYLDGYLAAGAGSYIDMVGFHWYYWLDPETVGSMVDNLRNLMKTYGVASKPVWITEGAFLCDSAQTDCSTAVPTLAQSRSVNARAMLTMAVKGVANFNFHVWEATDVVRKLVEADYVTQTEAGKAYAEARSWLAGARIEDSFTDSDSVHVVRLDRNGSDTWILWSTVDGATVQIPSDWNVRTVRSITRSETALPSTRQVQLGLEPVLLKP